MTDSVDEAGEDGLNASLKHLRSILMIDGTSNSKQVVKFEEQIKHLESQLKREKSLRAKQESSYEALSKYNKELTLQLESLAKANECNENKFNTANRALQTEKVNLHTQHEEWKAEKEKLKKELNEYKNEAEKSKIRLLYFQQQVKELTNVSDGLKGDIVKLEKEMEESRGGYEEKLRNEAKQRDDLKSMMQETETKLKKELEQVNQKLKEAKEEYSGAIESIGAFLKKEEHENTSIDSLSDESKSFEDLSEELHLKIAALGEKRVELDEELELSNQINEEKAIELEKCQEELLLVREELKTLKEYYKDESNQNTEESEEEEEEDDDDMTSASDSKEDKPDEDLTEQGALEESAVEGDEVIDLSDDEGDLNHEESPAIKRGAEELDDSSVKDDKDYEEPNSLSTAKRLKVEGEGDDVEFIDL